MLQIAHDPMKERMRLILQENKWMAEKLKDIEN